MEKKETANTYTEPPSRFYRNLLTLCAHKRIAVSRLGTDIGLSNSVTSYWARGSIPKYDILKKIADYFRITVEQLTETDIDSSVGLAVPISTVPLQESDSIIADKDAKIDRLLSIIESQQATIRGLQEDLSKQLSLSFRKKVPVGDTVYNDIIQV